MTCSVARIVNIGTCDPYRFLNRVHIQVKTCGCAGEGHCYAALRACVVVNNACNDRRGRLINGIGKRVNR